MNYSYDSASEITGINYQLAGTNLGNLGYSYDSDGRRTQVSGSWARSGMPNAVTATAYNANNQVTTWGTASLFYDLNGNMTSDGTHSYTWDSRNRLAKIDNGSSASFTYDPFGRRVGKKVFGTSTSFLFDSANTIQEVIGGTNTANSLVGGIDEVFQRTDSAGVRDFLTDALGSTLALTDSTGTVQTSYTFDPFGSTTSSGAGSTNTFEYSGRELDAGNLNLYFYRARYYNSALQRFISEDPLGFSGGDLNLYAYAGNNPISLVDPDGTLVHVARVGDTVHVTASITAYGPSASDELAGKWQTSINNHWNNNGNNFHVGHCKVVFDVTVQADPDHNHYRDALPADNKIYVNHDPYARSRTSSEGDHTYGVWRKWTWAAAHEFGHLAGLGDDYDPDSGLPSAGYAGHMMAQRGSPVAPHEVRDILSGHGCGCTH